MATTTTTAPAAPVTNEFGDTLTEADLVFNDADRTRMHTELSDIPAFKALLDATRPAA